MIELSQLKQYAHMQLNSAELSLVEFEDRFKENPSHALDWAIGTFEAAARKKIWTFVLNIEQRDRSNEEVVSLIAAHALNEAVNGARWPQRSTEPSSNLMHQCMTQAWANLYCEVVGN